MKKILNQSLLFFSITLFFSTAKAQETVGKLKEIKNHKNAVYLMQDIWMRDPFIELAPDGYYYLSCTRQNSNLNNEPGMQFFRSQDLVSWEDLGIKWKAKDSDWGKMLIEKGIKNNKEAMIWAPEIHFINGKWIIVSTSNQGESNIMVTRGNQLEGPFDEPFGLNFGRHHDPAIFMDGKTPWLIDKCAEITQLKEDYSGYVGESIKIDPSNRKMGHEGCYILKIGNKYVLFGTAWSTDKMRHGTYNLYYATADKVTGPFNERKFAGRFLGHGTPFKDKNGNWWCTAFYNANKPVLSGEEARQMDLADTAYTINKQGLTIVPIEFKITKGDVKVIVKDNNYASPGKEEVQKF
jgi:xylan 1,4-beta-xylosidase